jgi:hypothetical protein
MKMNNNQPTKRLIVESVHFQPTILEDIRNISVLPDVPYNIKLMGKKTMAKSDTACAISPKLTSAAALFN